MFQSRDEIRQVYLNVWSKMTKNLMLDPMEKVISSVIKLHPEYHSILKTGNAVKHKEFTPDGGETNPFLHMGMHIGLQEQTSTDRPHGIRDIHQTLCTKHGQHEAEHAMMECLGQAMWLAQRNNTTPDDQAYLECLRKL